MDQLTVLNYPRKLFYVTFGSQHPLRDNWIEVEASFATTAREIVFDTFGGKFGHCWEGFQFTPETRVYFPLGKAGHTLKGA